MADIQLIQCKKSTENVLKSRKYRAYKEIGVKESNGDVRILTGSSQIAVTAHAQ